MFAMADVYAVVFFLIGLFLSVPALLLALTLLLPRVTERAEIRLRRTPVKCFFAGLPILGFVLLFFGAASGAGGVVAGLGFIVLGLGMAAGSIGGAGMMRLLSGKLGRLAGDTPWKNMLRGAFIFELACLVPVVGWFVFLPLIATTTLGAAAFALVGWVPRPRTAVAPAPGAPAAPTINVLT